jgi:ankyrin repeat protein
MPGKRRGQRQGGMSRVDGALCLAALQGDAQNVAAFLQRGADARAAPVAAVLPIAAEDGYQPVVELLLDAGADINGALRSTGHTALMRAARAGHTGIVGMLLQRGANPNAQTLGSDFDALTYAAMNGHTDIVRLLLEAGADPNAGLPARATPLMWAALRGHAGALTALIDGGANVNARTSSGVNATRWARREAHDNIVELLKARGAREPTPPWHERLRDRIHSGVGRWSRKLIRGPFELPRR